jgi:hypothetical protein
VIYGFAVATGLTRDGRIPVLETKNSSMTSGCARSTFAAMDRIDGRGDDELRPVAFDLGIAPYAGGSVLVTMGNTRVICGVTIEENVPRWMKEQGVTGGWLTAEYSTQTRKPRDVAKGRTDGRAPGEIRSLNFEPQRRAIHGWFRAGGNSKHAGGPRHHAPH